MATPLTTHDSPIAARRRGFTLPEALAAVVIVTVAGSATLLAVSQSIQASLAGTDTARVNLLVQDLMDEITTCWWADTTSPTHWGPEAGETNSKKTRASFNDLDDYDGWSGPPQTKTGQTYDSLQQSLFPTVASHDYANYTCSVKVEYVSAAGDVLAAGQTSLYRQIGRAHV